MWDSERITQKILEWFSPNKGTVDATQYALGSIVSLLIIGLFTRSLFQGTTLNDPSVFGILFGLYSLVVVGIKRLRALNLSPWFLLIYLFTPINVLLFFYLIFTSRKEQNLEVKEEIRTEQVAKPQQIKAPKKALKIKGSKTPQKTVVEPKVKKEKKSSLKEVPAKKFKEVPIWTGKTVSVKDEAESKAENKGRSFTLKEVAAGAYFTNKSGIRKFKTTSAENLADISPEVKNQQSEEELLEKKADTKIPVNEEPQTNDVKPGNRETIQKTKVVQNTPATPLAVETKPTKTTTVISAPPLWLPFNHKSICLDTETTGISKRDRVCEVAALEFNPNTYEIVDKFHVYVNPCMRMPYHAWRVHGLSDAFLQDKPVFKDIAGDLLAFIQNSTVYIHNAAFDKRMLNAEFARLGMDSIENYCSEIQCTYQMAVRKRGRKNNKLDDLCNCYHIDNSNRQLHGALLDCELLVQVLQNLQKA